MLVLADSTATLDAVLAGAARPARAKAADLPQPERDLWRMLGPGPEVRRLELNEPRLAFWPRAVLVGRADGSQYDILKEALAPDPGPHCPVASLALEGRRFHGHRGRPWTARPGNLHLCVALAPGAPASRLGLALTMLPAVAVVDALRAVSDGALQPGIKWVNDILLDGRKVGGVLTGSQAQGSRLDLVVLGIGLNVAEAPRLEPTPFVPAVTCLRDEPGGEDVELGMLFKALLAALATRYLALLSEGAAGLFAAYRDASLIVGRRVRIWPEGLDDGRPPANWPPPLAEGVVREIRPDLSLRLEGRPEPVTQGRLALVVPESREAS
jgi:biotin-[acetyl-CoA-carboxylase] ligase BirA-like protein